MKKKISYLLLLFLIIILQTSFLPLVMPLHVMPDAVLMLILVGAIFDGFQAFFWWAIVAGVIYDLVTYNVVGLHSIIFLLVVYFVSFFSRRFSVELRGVGLVLFLGFIIVSSVISHVVATIVQFLSNDQAVNHLKSTWMMSAIGIEIICNVFLFFILFVSLRKAKSFL
jgi:rod shape-determining protein MreD